MELTPLEYNINKIIEEYYDIIPSFCEVFDYKNTSRGFCFDINEEDNEYIL